MVQVIVLMLMLEMRPCSESSRCQRPTAGRGNKLSSFTVPEDETGREVVWEEVLS